MRIVKHMACVLAGNRVLERFQCCISVSYDRRRMIALSVVGWCADWDVVCDQDLTVPVRGSVKGLGLRVWSLGFGV